MQYTVRGIPPTLDAALRESARTAGMSLNEAAVDIVTESFVETMKNGSMAFMLVSAANGELLDSSPTLDRFHPYRLGNTRSSV